MPKPRPPAALRRVPVICDRPELLADDRFEIVKPFKLSCNGRDALALALGLSALPPLIASTLEEAISRFKAQSRVPFVTAGQNIAALDVALSAAAGFEASLRPFVDLKCSGVGDKTSKALNPTALEALSSLRKFRTDAQSRKEKLLTLGRLGAEHGPLGGLCSLAKFVFAAPQTK
jgi:hypothetical protein